jgi:hypothetical protein
MPAVMEFFRAMSPVDLRKYMKDTIPGFVPTFRSDKGHRNWKTKAMMLKELAAIGEKKLMRGLNQNKSSIRVTYSKK